MYSEIELEKLFETDLNEFERASKEFYYRLQHLFRIHENGAYGSVSNDLRGARMLSLGIGRRINDQELEKRILATNTMNYDYLEEELPIELRDLVRSIPEEFWNVISDTFGLEQIFDPQKKTATQTEKGSYLKRLALEACNRACGHCSTSATAGLEHMSMRTLETALEKFDLSDTVFLTYGEAFYWREEGPKRQLNCGDLVELLFERGAKKIHIVTSGIDINNPLELAAMRKLESLDQKLRKNIIIELTISDYPVFHGTGNSRTESARAAQIETIVRSILAGFEIRLINFLSEETLRRELINPVVSIVYPDSPKEMAHILKEDRKPGLIGRFGRKQRRYKEEKEYRIDPTTCLANQDQIDMALTPDGNFVPGCCALPSQHIVIAHSDEEDEEIRKKTREFVSNLKKAKNEGTLNCIKCAEIGNGIRHVKRFRQNVGPDIANGMELINPKRLLALHHK